MEIKAQAAMLLTLVEENGKESFRASVLSGTNSDLNDTARDMAGALVSMANNPNPPFDEDPRIAALTAEVERLKSLKSLFIDYINARENDPAVAGEYWREICKLLYEFKDRPDA